jgi:hypothetical protein
MKGWKRWVLVAMGILTPAVAFAATHAGSSGCGCPWCPF